MRRVKGRMAAFCGVEIVTNCVMGNHFVSGADCAKANNLTGDFAIADDAEQRQTHPLGSSPALAQYPIDSRLRDPTNPLSQIFSTILSIHSALHQRFRNLKHSELHVSLYLL